MTNPNRDPARSTRIALPLVVWLCLSIFASIPSAFAAVPGEVNYQGLLLDDLGDPINGTADFEFRLYDVDAGGTALWSEAHAAVPVVDGVYDVALGSITPISASVLAGGTLYLEIDVDTETLSPRQRLLAVPYSMRAAVAEEASNVGGISAAYYEAILTAAPWDGAEPGNFDAAEGLGDTDDDGLPNFMDPDNDNDGLSDAVEFAAGSDINLKTPDLTSVSPSLVRDDLPSIVTVFGANFEPSMTVQIGGEVGSLSNVTSTSAEVSIGIHPAATENVVVTLANGQSSTLLSAIQFYVFTPTLTSVSPSTTLENTPTLLTISGTNFEPTMTVEIGAEVGVLGNVTATSAEVSIGGHAAGAEDVTVTLQNGQSATLVDGIAFTVSKIFFVTSASYSADFGGVAVADAACNFHASAGSLPGTFQAWISDGIISPASRSTRVGTPYVDTLGGTLASNWAALMDPSMGNIRRDENGVDIGSSLRVWTNVDDLTLGSAGSNHCSGWTSTAGTGQTGLTGVTGNNWTNSSSAINCTLAAHLYCIQQ
jgi:hypothetical protein